MLKLEQPHVERQLNFHFTEGKVNHLDIFVPMQREIISEQLLIDNAAHYRQEIDFCHWILNPH